VAVAVPKIDILPVAVARGVGKRFYSSLV